MTTTLAELVADRSSFKRFVVRFKAWDPETLSEKTFYYADKGFATEPDEAPPNLHIPGRILRPLTHSRSMFSGSKIGGLALPDFGETVLINADEKLDFLTQLYVDGRDCDVFIGGEIDILTNFHQIFCGVMDAIEADDKEISLRVKSSLFKLDRAFHQDIYGTSAEDDIEGKPIPETLGQVKNVTPVLIDSTGFVYQVHNGQIQSIDAVYDEGVLQVLDTDYTVDLNAGTIDFAAAPNGKVTVDLKGSKEGGVYVNTISDIVQRVGGYRGITEFDTLAFSAFKTAVPEIVGIYVKDPSNTLDELSFLVNSRGGFLTDNRTGQLTIGLLSEPTTATEILGPNAITNVDMEGIERCNLLRTTDTSLGGDAAQNLYPKFWAPNNAWYGIHDVISVGVEDDFDYIEVRLNGTPAGDMRIAFDTERTNHIPNSEDFTAASWVKTDTLITPNDGIGPDGTLSADAMVHTSTAALVSDQAVFNPGFQPVVQSVYVRKDEHRWYMLRTDDGTNSVTTWFDAQTGMVGSNSVGGVAEFLQAGVVDETSTYWRIWFAARGFAGNIDYDIAQVDGDGSTATVIGSTGHPIRAQHKPGTDDPTSYIKTTGQAVTAAVIPYGEDRFVAGSVYLKLISGDLTNIDAMRLGFDEWPSGGTTVGTVHTGPNITPTGTRNRFLYEGAATDDDATTGISPYLELTHTSGPVDLTFRIYRPMFEESRLVTSFIEGGQCAPLEETAPVSVPTISRSLLFTRGGESSSGTPANGPNTYMHRTPSVEGDRRKFTFATWLRRHNIHADNEYLWWTISGGHPKFDEASWIGFIKNTNRIRVQFNTGTTYPVVDTTTQFAREDVWSHLVVAVDTEQAVAADRVKVFVNSVQETLLPLASGLPPLNFDTHFNRAAPHFLGRREFNVDHLNAVLADTYWIDGLALTPADFTTWTGAAWVPKLYTGAMGTNGWHLDYQDNGSVAALGTDVSVAGNDLTVENFLTTDQKSDDLPTSPVVPI